MLIASRMETVWELLCVMIIMYMYIKLYTRVLMGNVLYYYCVCVVCVRVFTYLCVCVCVSIIIYAIITPSRLLHACTKAYTIYVCICVCIQCIIFMYMCMYYTYL